MVIKCENTIQIFKRVLSQRAIRFRLISWKAIIFYRSVFQKGYNASDNRSIAAPQRMAAPIVDGYNSTAMEIKWKQPSSPNGPTPLYTVQKTNIAISYPASVVRGTRFPGGGYYTFPAQTLPQNVDFTGQSIHLFVQIWDDITIAVYIEPNKDKTRKK